MSRRNRNHRSTSSDESFSPVAKRTRAAKANQKEAPDLVQAKEKSEPTILDILNEDCWRYVLDYVSVRDIVRSERVSRQWQRTVHNYLRGARLCIRSSIYLYLELEVPSVRCRVVTVGPVYYIKVIEKFGPAIVASDCLSGIELRTLGKNSPDLEELTLRDEHYHIPKNLHVHFNRLRKLHIRQAVQLEDSDITKLLRYSTLEELKISRANMMTGVCLNNLKSNLNCLCLKALDRLDIDHMLAASHRLADITILDLSVNTRQVLQNVSKILPETPKLEYLGLEWYSYTKVVGLVDAICDLKRLKHLSLRDNDSVRDEWLQALGQRCQLQSLDVSRCTRTSPAGVEAFCRGASRTLTALGLSCRRVTDEDVVRCITLCPDLELLDLQSCQSVSRSLPARVAALGRRAITLRLRKSTYRDNPLLDLQCCPSVSRSLPARVAALGRRAITLRLSKYTYWDNPITETYSNVALDWNGGMHLLRGLYDF